MVLTARPLFLEVNLMDEPVIAVALSSLRFTFSSLSDLSKDRRIKNRSMKFHLNYDAAQWSTILY